MRLCVGLSDSLDCGFPTPNSNLGIDLAAFIENMIIISFDFPPVLTPLIPEDNHGVAMSAYSAPSLDSDSPMLVVDPSRPSSRNLSIYPAS